ncbi:MAG: hypothetical protein E6Q92_13135 [Burkholderiaceae bacterium]|nr:MAG: hypothetical protein E6Q92_13135 [Burkholderiaceae bacterium]
MPPHMVLMRRSAEGPGLTASFERALYDDELMPHIFTAQGLLPGVAALEDIRGTWGHPSSSRRLRLTDGGSLLEHLQQAGPGLLSYRADDFDSWLLKRLAHQSQGEFRWERTGERTLRCTWTYGFQPRGALSRLLLKVLLPLLWKPYMDGALSRLLALSAR